MLVEGQKKHTHAPRRLRRVCHCRTSGIKCALDPRPASLGNSREGGEVRLHSSNWTAKSIDWYSQRDYSLHAVVEERQVKLHWTSPSYRRRQWKAISGTGNCPGVQMSGPGLTESPLHGPKRQGGSGARARCDEHPCKRPSAQAVQCRPRPRPKSLVSYTEPCQSQATLPKWPL